MQLPARYLSFIMLLLTVIACGDQQAPTAQQQAERSQFIVAANTPLQYFAQRLLDGEIEVRMLAPEKTDPAQWLPSVGDVLQLQQAQLILLNGAGYSNWLSKVSISDSILVNTSSTVRERWIELEGQVSHSHGPTGEHAHGSYAYTTWMDMSLAQIQAKAIASALQERWPEKIEGIDRNLAALLADLNELDQGFMTAATRLRGRQLVYSHPVYQYFERRYRLPGVSLHWEPDHMPSEEHWTELQGLNSGDILFIWEAKPAAEIADRMRKLDIEFVVFAPAANQREKDWMSVQKENHARLSSK
ncbi:MAG: metal ABC transporter substrate-binding protein [Halioglobus sp.]